MALSQISRMGNDKAKTYFKRKVSEGKSKSQALVCLRRQMVNMVWCMMKHGTIYDIHRNDWLSLIADLPAEPSSFPAFQRNWGWSFLYLRVKYKHNWEIPYGALGGETVFSGGKFGSRLAESEIPLLNRRNSSNSIFAIGISIIRHHQPDLPMSLNLFIPAKILNTPRKIISPNISTANQEYCT